LPIGKMPTRDRLAGKATSIVIFGWQISIIKTMFTNNAVPYEVHHLQFYY
jgi:hypothetical protein